MIEKNVLLPLVVDFIKNKIDNVSTGEEDDKMKLKSYLKKDENNCFVIFDKEYSIKCVFDTKNLNEYLMEQSGHVKYENFENSLILIKKSYFDLLFVKNLDKTLSVRVIIYIQEFEVDTSQKSKDKTTKKNLNSNQSVVQLLKDYLYKFSKECLDLNFKFQNVSAINFIKNEFPMITENIPNISSKNSSIFKIIANENNNILLNTGVSLDNEQSYLNEVLPLNDNPDESTKDNINIENLLKLDFINLFYKQPSQKAIGRQVGDLSVWINDEGKMEEKEENPEFLNKKSHRNSKEDEDRRLIPESIKELVLKYKDRKFTIDTYEKYKLYRSNSKLNKI